MGIGFVVTVIVLGAVLGVVARQTLSTKEDSIIDRPQTVDAAYDEVSANSHAM